jgi:aminoglycoside phosphotransferase (APT) family kinase protein
MQRSTRDLTRTRDLLQRWLGDHLTPGAEPTISALVAPAANGMSSETLLFDATWTDDGVRRQEAMVARVAPEDTAVPVFRTYDLHRQFRVIQKVGELTDVPVPTVYWSEPDPAKLGSPFFVMGRVEGEVPPDVLPYNFGDSWLYHADLADQARLQEASVAVLANLHDVPDATREFEFLEFAAPGATHLRRHINDWHEYYEWAVSGGRRSPLVERCFDWLEAHWPEVEGPPVLSWGDSRIGNIMYRDFTPVAVLDWEMAALAPREVDVAWMVFMHRVFEDMAVRYQMGGMPKFMQQEEVLASYERLTGYTPRDLDFYLMYAAVRWGVVMIRTQLRQIHFGDAVMPEDPDDLIMTRDTLERMLRA